LCQPACGAAADCDLGSAPYDSDNYTCSAGYCHYTGCNGDGECQTLGNFVCRDTGYGVLMCIGACGTTADCSTGQAPYDADNYACTDGYCHYTGCNSDTECQALGNYVCRDLGWGPPLCIMACGVAADCSTGQLPYDADNYACTDGYCSYTGCNSDTECQALGNYVCR